jgi:hypothetical protein
MFGDVLECTYFNLFGGSKVTVNQCTASNVMAPEHNNQFGVYKKFIFCKVTVNKQQHRYIGMHKNAIIICVVNGLAFSMVTVFEDFFLIIRVAGPYTSLRAPNYYPCQILVLSSVGGRQI